MRIIRNISVRDQYLVMAADKKRKEKSAPSPEKESAFTEGVKNFGEEAGALGKKVGKKGHEWRSWYYDTFGIIGPLISAILGLVCLALGIWALEFIAGKTGAVILTGGMREFLLSNAGVFFVIFLVSSYAKYLSQTSRSACLLISPFATAFGISVFLWVMSNIIIIDSSRIGNGWLYVAAQHVRANLFGIFVFVLIAGYFFAFILLLAGRVS